MAKATSMGLVGGPQAPKRNQTTLKSVAPSPIVASESSGQTRPYQQSLDLRPRLSGIPEPVGSISLEAMTELTKKIAAHNAKLDKKWPPRPQAKR